MVNITEIGITAGDIWQCLDKGDSTSVDSLVASINKDRDLVLMSLGWLAREGHVEVKSTGNGLTAHLISRES